MSQPSKSTREDEALHYEAPTLHLLGDLIDLTQGSGTLDPDFFEPTTRQES